MRVQKFLIAAAVAAAALVPMAAMAGLGQPSPWQISFQQSASPIMDQITWFHDFLLIVITLIKPDLPQWLTITIAVAAIAVVILLLIYAFRVFRDVTKPGGSR